MQFEKAINIYLRSRSSRLAPNTIRVYEQNLRYFHDWIGEIELSAITDEHIDDYLFFLKDKYHARTRALHAFTIRAFFKFWYAKRKSDVAWEIICGPRVAEKFPEFISQEKFDLIDECFDEDEYYQLTKKVIFHLLWNTGMRISELMALNISDINLKEKYAIITTAKSKRLRIVMWNDYCHRLLLRYLGIRINLNNRPELFQSPPGLRNHLRTRLSARTVQRWCRESEAYLGFRIHPHAFRHGKCHQIITKGGNRHDVQTIAGHSNITASEIYVRLNIQEQEEMMSKFLPKGEDKRVDRPIGLKSLVTSGKG